MAHCLQIDGGGTAGPGKTALLRQLYKARKDHHNIPVVTINDR